MQRVLLVCHLKMSVDLIGGPSLKRSIILYEVVIASSCNYGSGSSLEQYVIISSSIPSMWNLISLIYARWRLNESRTFKTFINSSLFNYQTKDCSPWPGVVFPNSCKILRCCRREWSSFQRAEIGLIFEPVTSLLHQFYSSCLTQYCYHTLPDFAYLQRHSQLTLITSIVHHSEVRHEDAALNGRPE